MVRSRTQFQDAERRTHTALRFWSESVVPRIERGVLYTLLRIKETILSIYTVAPSLWQKAR